MFSIYSTADELIGFGDVVWGRYTSVWATVDASQSFSFETTKVHMALRDTAAAQYNLIARHTFTSAVKEKGRTFLSME